MIYTAAKREVRENGIVEQDSQSSAERIAYGPVNERCVGKNKRLKPDIECRRQ